MKSSPSVGTVIASVGVLLAHGAQAEVRSAAAGTLVVEHRFQLSTTPQAAWAVLVHPERYWPSDHTWSGSAGNLSLVPEAGGCYCERWAGGSAQHGVVAMAIPGKRLRIRGALGPFQEMPVTGVLTVSLAARDGGTEAVVTYSLAGDETARLGDMASVVDGVVRQQFAGFAALASAPTP
jgi:uncharacterized protein YndB with AHSA1/START domain